MPERADWSVLHGMLDKLTTATENLTHVQRESRRITGVAWSDDRLIKAVVGPRGQLLDLELDPRLFRRPDSAALSAAIVATVRIAVDEAMRHQREILDRHTPADLASGLSAFHEQLAASDAELRGHDDQDGDGNG